MSKKIGVSIGQIIAASVVACVSVFLAVLFRPGEAVGMYSWLVRPEYVITMSKVITVTFIPIAIFVTGFGILFIIKNNILAKKIVVINVLYLVCFANIYMFTFISDNDLLSVLLRLMLVGFLCTLMIFFFSCIACYVNDTKWSLIVILPPMVAGVVFITINALMYIGDNSSTIADFGRMYGTTEHPNFLGVNAAIVSLLLVLVRNSLNEAFHAKQIKKKYDYLILSLIAISIAIIVLSGSRTALLLLVSGLMIYFVKKESFKHSLLILMFSVLFMFFLLVIDTSNLRVLSTENTRGLAWEGMLEIFYNNPLVGVGFSGLKYSENSYLRILLASGLLGSLPYFLLILHILIKSLAEQTWCLIVLLPLFIIANLEGFLLDSFSYPNLIFLYIMNASLLFETKKNRSSQRMQDV